MREIQWTEHSEAHIARHDVDPSEVEQLVYTRPRLVTSGREGTTLIFGTTDAGRQLLVVVSEGQDGRWFVVTARPMSERERRAFERRSR